MTALHTLGILSTSFMRNAFPTVLKEFPHAEHLLAAFFHSVVQLIRNHLIWVEVGWLWRLGHLMQHSITLLLGQIALHSLEVCWVIVLLKNTPHQHTSFSMLHGGNHTCGGHPFTYSVSHKDTAVRTKNLTFGLIRPKDRFSPVNVHCTCFLA